ncbi:hypothetical protein COK21_18105 [Bacillus cereus]|nr:hypothetical protein COK21_18105 [Bacillus cereus]
MKYNKMQELLSKKAESIKSLFIKKLGDADSKIKKRIDELAKVLNEKPPAVNHYSRIYKKYQEKVPNIALAILDYDVIPKFLDIAKERENLNIKFKSGAITLDEYSAMLSKIEEKEVQRGYIKYVFATSNFNEESIEVNEEERSQIESRLAKWEEKIKKMHENGEINEDKRKELLENINKLREMETIVDFRPIVREFEKEKTLICLERPFKHYYMKRLDENLKFERVPNNLMDRIENKRTCCERKIFEYIKEEHFQLMKEKLENTVGYNTKEEIESAAEKAKLKGTILVFTKYEPCLYCYNLMEEIKKENPDLILKVYHDSFADGVSRIDGFIEEYQDNGLQMMRIMIKQSFLKAGTNKEEKIDKLLLGKSSKFGDIIDKLNNINDINFMSQIFEKILSQQDTEQNEESILAILEEDICR